MNLKSKLAPGEYVSVAAADSGYVDAGVSGNLAGLEMEILGDRGLIVNESDPRPNSGGPVLSISMSPARLSELALVALDKLGTPAFTEPEWQAIAGALRATGTAYERASGESSTLLTLAHRIDAAYGGDDS